MFNNKDLERYSRQIILKKVGILGQSKIKNSKVLVVGCGGLGSPVIDLLSRAGIGEIGMLDHDKVSISNIHRQVMFTSDDVGKYKVSILKKKISKINKNVKVKIYRDKAEDKNLGKILKLYDVIVDGTDNFKAKFLLNKFSLKYKKKLIIGAISKFEGHIFTFDFNLKKSPCLKCFYQGEPSEGVLDCETDGILGSTAVVTGSLQANEVLKAILNVGKNLNSHILIIDLLNLKFRKALFKKRKGCICENI
ncbi:HesA/MoeB/ThiF family protein [Pelagibacterales bacterium SAG-MED23]|nr:HesA/MoeB/ThiF family protein [Pelagibacterales bacterium SAG-MED23]